MLRLKDLLAMGENQLEQAKVPDYAHDARALMEFAFNLDRSQMFMKWADDIDDVWCDNYLDIVHRRALGEPLQYITGVQNFMGIDFKVNENVLIPRQDTERVVENARLIVESKTTKKTADPESPYIYETVAARKNWKILDLCCGSGAIGISMAKLCPNVKKVLCTDISGEALSVAKENAKAAGVEKKVDFASGDMFEALGKRAKFDMIISNPPYIESSIIHTLQREVREYEPMLALDGGEDGLDFYRTIIEQAPKFLDKKGILVLEIGYNQAEEISAMLEETDAFAKTEIVRDYGGNNRVVCALLK